MLGARCTGGWMAARQRRATRRCHSPPSDWLSARRRRNGRPAVRCRALPDMPPTARPYEPKHPMTATYKPLPSYSALGPLAPTTLTGTLPNDHDSHIPLLTAPRHGLAAAIHGGLSDDNDGPNHSWPLQLTLSPNITRSPRMARVAVNGLAVSPRRPHTAALSDALPLIHAAPTLESPAPLP